ncbi:MAG: hypothetical protein WCK65_10085 [Rhodospirillaceae bacterium]
MKMTTAILLGLLCGILMSGASIAQAAQDGIPQGGIPKMSLTLAESTANVVILQEPPRSTARSDGFISLDTVIIGCTAGAAAGALAIALPVLTIASSGIGLPASVSAILSTAGIGCAVGMVSGLAAIGTAWTLGVISGPGDAAPN